MILEASSAKTVTGNSAAASICPFNPTEAFFELDLTAAAAASGDTLDVKIQTKSPGGNWVDVVAFTQILGDGGTKRYFAKVNEALAETMFENATALSAGSVRNLLGTEWRAAWTIAGATQTFTFAVNAQFSGD